MEQNKEESSSKPQRQSRMASINSPGNAQQGDRMDVDRPQGQGAGRGAPLQQILTSRPQQSTQLQVRSQVGVPGGSQISHPQQDGALRYWMQPLQQAQQEATATIRRFSAQIQNMPPMPRSLSAPDFSVYEATAKLTEGQVNRCLAFNAVFVPSLNAYVRIPTPPFQRLHLIPSNAGPQPHPQLANQHASQVQPRVQPRPQPRPQPPGTESEGDSPEPVSRTESWLRHQQQSNKREPENESPTLPPQQPKRKQPRRSKKTPPKEILDRANQQYIHKSQDPSKLTDIIIEDQDELKAFDVAREQWGSNLDQNAPKYGRHMSGHPYWICCQDQKQHAASGFRVMYDKRIGNCPYGVPGPSCNHNQCKNCLIVQDEEVDLKLKHDAANPYIMTEEELSHKRKFDERIECEDEA
ncbi:MAG: hypothetical protein M1834_005589 [Cirrosporium novae-zelandiae]|nr:MAG: hypothetical protein M1834_005589 [Cirrosporium novae-zelandiae]